MMDTRFGRTFRLPTGSWVNPFVQEKTLAKKGYKLGSVMKPAWACIAGSGKGLSGMTTCYVKIFVSDINYAVNECDNKIV